MDILATLFFDKFIYYSDYAAFYITFMELIGKQKLDVIDFDVEIAKLK